METMMSSRPWRLAISATISIQRSSLVTSLLQENRLAAGFCHALDELRASQLVDVGDDDGSAFAREQFDDSLANARGAARHQRDLALNLPCHVHSLFCCLSGLFLTHDLRANAYRVCREGSCVI
ncbi:hypothetical protein ABIF97_006947 [Bradyrhizobium japonicum]